MHANYIQPRRIAQGMPLGLSDDTFSIYATIFFSCG